MKKGQARGIVDGLKEMDILRLFLVPPTKLAALPSTARAVSFGKSLDKGGGGGGREMSLSDCDNKNKS